MIKQNQYRKDAPAVICPVLSRTFEKMRDAAYEKVGISQKTGIHRMVYGRPTGFQIVSDPQ